MDKGYNPYSMMRASEKAKKDFDNLNKRLEEERQIKKWIKENTGFRGAIETSFPFFIFHAFMGFSVLMNDSMLNNFYGAHFESFFGI